MKITFIGSSHGVPEGDRRCACTMIEVEDRRYFIDMGTQVIEDVRRRHIPEESIKGVFITHMHGDHTNGLVSFVDLISWYFKTCFPRVVVPEQMAVEVLKAWLMVNHNHLREDIEFQVTQEGMIYNDGVLKVTAFKTKHIDPSYAYLVEAEGKRVLFTGDLKGPQIDFPLEALKDPVDLVIAEAAHFSPVEYLPIMKEQEIGRWIINHYQPRKVPEVWTLKQQAQIPVELAMDEMEVEL
ncbi:MAG: MBL fold metallo-hydrolase [Clostridiales bacterium]|nr:MBL fold metallo-hydrolase [Clostridiales bacterium]